ncbi:protein LONG AFTER FAR-RED 3 isoform X2 [Aristolochia californica]|uniref:protein LONG AFTER FAR-RED 3 isoform X2 n=1 Tax=Aristolochia californica TaxID=171875 RepID=UPI0035DB939A
MMGKNFLLFISATSVLILAIVLFPAFDTTRNRTPVADLIVKNADIYTSDSAHPFAEAMAIRLGRILRIGNYSSVQELIGPGTEQLDVAGKLVVPGFIDSHVHLIPGGLQMKRVKLRDARSRVEFVQKVKEAVVGKTKGSWVLGGGWNNEFWGKELPEASWIDDVSSENPVWLSRMDGHMGLANSLALKMAGITKNTDDPAGGTIVRTANGEPTGMLVDSAMKLLLSSIPDVSIDERRDALVRASKLALMRGVTTVVDLGRYFPGESAEAVWKDFSDVYNWADSTGKMLIRVCLFFPMETWSRLADLIKARSRVISHWIYLGGAKAFSDGSLGSNSALFYEPYVDEPQNNGLHLTDKDWLLKTMILLDKLGLQIAVHAIGDKANDLMLDLYDSISTANGLRDRRPRIEHAQHLAPEAVKRFGQLSVIASVQPDHLLDDANSAEKKLGVDRAQRGSYLFQSLLSSGAQIAFGSDWPVADINPLQGIRTAVRRIPPGWENAWIASERVKPSDALNAYTISAAFACFLDHELGSLTPGKLADFVVLSTSWEDFEENVSASVLATYVGGKLAYFSD